MITAVDTSVLLDVFLPDDKHGPRSREWLRNAYDRGAILVCDVVYAELVPAFQDRVSLEDALKQISVTISPISTAIAPKHEKEAHQWGEAGYQGARQKEETPLAGRRADGAIVSGVIATP